MARIEIGNFLNGFVRKLLEVKPRDFTEDDVGNLRVALDEMRLVELPIDADRAHAAAIHRPHGSHQGADVRFVPNNPAADFSSCPFGSIWKRVRVRWTPLA